MDLTTMHRIDVKAALQKQFGSVAAFERERDLPEKSVNDVLRGRPRERVRKAIEEALAPPTDIPVESEFSDTSAEGGVNHRLIAGGR